MTKRWAGVARLGGVGDNLVAASVLAPLKKMGYMVEVITSPPNHVVFHHNPHIDKLSIKSPGEIPEGEAWQKWFESRANEYDIFAHLSHSMEVRHSLFPHMSQFWLRPEYRRKICAGSYLETVHDIAGVPYEFGPLYYASQEEKQRAAETKVKTFVPGSKVVGWVLGGTRIDKIYPYAAMAIGRLIKELDVSVMMVGAGGRQFGDAKAIMEHIERQNSTHGKLHLALSPETADPGGDMSWPLRRSLAQTLACDLVITPDTGFAWATAFEPMPKIVMVSHASVENITSHWINTTTLHADPDRVPCWPCHRLHNDPSTCVPNKENKGAACISDISVETIVSTAKTLLS